MNNKNYVKIDIDNLKDNITFLKNKYKYDYYIMDVSNNAFNHGMYIINYLEQMVDYLYVNNLNDIDLIRKFNKDISIIFDGAWEKDNILDFINKDVTLIINDLKELEEINNYDLYDKFNIILNIDLKGMMGFSTKTEIKNAVDRIANKVKLNLVGIKSHIEGKDYAQFLYLINPLRKFEIKISILNNENDKNKINNSNAILFDKSIYGINDNSQKLFASKEKNLKQVFNFYSKIYNIKKEIKGKKEKFYAIIPYGYLNGMNDKITKVWINNRLYNVLEVNERYTVIIVDNIVNIGDEVLVTGYDNPLENYINLNTLLYFNIFNSNLPILYNDYSLEKIFVY